MPVTVYGYVNTVSFAGSIYGAETKCTFTHNWGQVANPQFCKNSLLTGLSACMAATGPTESLKFFKTFA